MYSSRDNWERLVTAVVRKQQIWELFHSHSRSPSISTIASSDDFSEQFLEWSETSSSVSPLPLDNPPSLSKVGKKSGGANITRKLFPPNWYRANKTKNISGVRTFSLNELEIATDNFADINILFRDGFAKSYKGRLANGILVAIKRYEQVLRFPGIQDFETEVETMSIVNAHPNLLRLIGICVTQKEKMLVHPYMANGSVESCLGDRPESQPPLGWQIRKHIAFGAAKGLAYLHDDCERKIIHRDVNAANIYLNEDFEAIIGKRAYDRARLDNDEDVMLLDWVKTQVKEKEWERIVDPDIGGNNYYIEEEVKQLIRIALRCTQGEPERRPDMSEIVRIILPHGDGLLAAQMWEEFCDEEIIPDSPRQSDELSSPR
ncbi:hypothetical protein ABFS83_07G094500 [Erythranthe nasuta]